jgi:tripartite-type tricarboxylate transporter receptor subunit TctC
LLRCASLEVAFCRGKHSNSLDDVMKLPRRRFLHLASGAAALPVVSRIAKADAYPIRSVRMIVGFPAGNASDILARLVAQSLSERLGHPFIIENRPGAGGTIGTEVVVRAAPDGYALLMEVMTANAINATLYDKLNYDFIRDIAPVAGIGRASFVMVVNPSVPTKTVPEFIAYAKANPSKVNMASAGNGTATHAFGALFMMLAGVDMVHVPYRGSFMPDLLGGQVQVVFGPIVQLVDQVQTGKLRALAVTAATRQALLPDIPTVAETLPGYEATVWYGLGAPKKTPAEIIEKLNIEVAAALAGEAMKVRFAELACTPMPVTSVEFGKFTAAEIEKWAKVIRAANIKRD